MAHDRAWRNLASHPISPQNVMTKAWPQVKSAFTADASPASTQADAIPEPKRDRAILPVAMMVMVGVSFGGVLGLVGWPVLQAFGLVNEPAAEVVQRNQAELMSRLDSAVQALSATVIDLSARVASTSDKQETASQFMAEVDARFIALRRSVRALHEAQNAASESWLQPVAELNAAATKARSDIAKVRASLDELSRVRNPEAATIGARLDRIEQAMAQQKLPGAIRGSIHATTERPRSLASIERSTAAGGHIFELKLAE